MNWIRRSKRRMQPYYRSCEFRPKRLTNCLMSGKTCNILRWPRESAPSDSMATTFKERKTCWWPTRKCWSKKCKGEMIWMTRKMTCKTILNLRGTKERLSKKLLMCFRPRRSNWSTLFNSNSKSSSSPSSNHKSSNHVLIWWSKTNSCYTIQSQTT